MGAPLDEIVASLRSSGLSKVDSIKAVAELTGKTLLAAKEVVHSSPVWGDAHEAGEFFHDLAEESAREDSDH